jgi:hypothetical protein
MLYLFWAISSDHVTVLSDTTIAVYMIHKNNVSPKKNGGRVVECLPYRRDTKDNR